MAELTVPAGTLSALAKYIAQWLRGLRKASAERKAECIRAINAVIVGVRRTQAYTRQRDLGSPDHRTEADLAVMWTQLGHELERLKVPKLAKRCDVKGQYWASPERFSTEWLDQADVGLSAVDALARQLKAQVQANGAPP